MEQLCIDVVLDQSSNWMQQNSRELFLLLYCSNFDINQVPCMHATWLESSLYCSSHYFHIILFVNSCDQSLEFLMDDTIMWTIKNSISINKRQVKSKLKIWTTILNCDWKDYSSKLFFVLSIQLTLAIFGCLLLFQIAGSNFSQVCDILSTSCTSIWRWCNMLQTCNKH